jgi:hypothetical protein
MKKIILFILIFFVLIGFAYSFEWRPANQGTVAWDAVTTLSDGNPIPATDTVKYKIYLRDELNQITENQETDATSATISFSVEGKYHIGVSTMRYKGAEKLGESGINWSNENGEYTPNPFGFMFYLAPATPVGLK